MQLAGKVLIAMPGMEDPRFARSVVLVCAHSPESAMGLIVNKPRPDLTFASILGHLGLEPPPARGETAGERAADATGPGPVASGAREIRVHFGGPVERGRGFVLHSADWRGGEATMEVPGGFRLTGTLDVLEALASGEGPTRALLALGYAGWGPGQVESEILRNDWLISDVPPELIFLAPDAEKWTRALAVLGIDPITLSASAGRA
ncbi:YqgE/AlgH family protein [Pseudogemmobacter sonorensis]|uniref:YqgE/AlgH family protein n=1 Tax=Pseudogemmobacter sonorensis TaxID=2989681 RepID=UPI00367ADA8C